jgi:hypothetical protein
MTNNRAQTSIFGAPQKTQRRSRPGQIYQQKKQHQDQYLPLQ